MSWMNGDGLYVTFGAEKAQPSKGGAVSTLGANKLVEAVISDFTKLGTTAEIIGTEDGGASFGVIIPKGAFIEKVEILMTTAATSAGSATLDIGLIKSSDRSTAIDDDGLAAAVALTAIDADGDVVELVQGSTGHGALVGTTLTENGVLCVSYNTAAFTAGAAKVRVYYV